MPDPVNTNEFLWVVNPIKNAVITNSEFAKTGEILGHSGQPPVND